MVARIKALFPIFGHTPRIRDFFQIRQNMLPLAYRLPDFVAQRAVIPALFFFLAPHGGYAGYGRTSLRSAHLFF